MTATLSASAAILKTRYPDGRLPKAQYVKFPIVAQIKKAEDFDGQNYVVALMTENPQGSSADFPTALGSLAQGTYSRFLVTRVEHFGIARIKGQALKAAQKQSGALVDLWRSETDGINATELKCLETYITGNGSGVLGQATFSGTTATLVTATDVVFFDIGMRVGAVSDSTLSPTVRSGFDNITGVDRSAGTLTGGTAWTTAITGLANNDYLTRAGDNASAGTAAVVIGWDQWVVGGASPGTLFGLNRNTDPVRLAGQNFNATGVTMTDSVIEADGLLSIQGVLAADKRLWVNPRDKANMFKSLDAKVQYPRVKVESSVAGVSFEAVQIESDYGTIKCVMSPFIRRNNAYLGDWDHVRLHSLGPAPQMLDWDGNNFLRVANDDAYEVRFGMYGQQEHDSPVSWIRLTNFGA